MISEEEGAISVWLTLLSMCVISFILVAMDGIKVNNARIISKQSANLATYSCMADYDIDVYENYNVYVMEESNIKAKYLEYASACVNHRVFNKKENLLDDRMDIMGLSVNNVVIYDIEHLNNKNLLNQINKNQEIYTYISENFSSYKNLYTKGYMKRKYLYELEFIAGGRKTDNENMRFIKDKLKGKISAQELEDMSCTAQEYTSYIIELIEQINIDIVADRMIELMINNINDTFHKNLKKGKLIVGIKVKTRFDIENRIQNIISIWNMISNNPNRYYTTVSTEYSY